jgi:MFS family permease
VVGVLTLIYACHALDRSLPNILVEPIRHEFDLSDSQLGVFSGLAFGAAFSAAALPMGFVSDRVGNRRNLLTVVVALWSLLTVLGGLTRSFVQLILVRIGLGAAEAGTAPLTMPMLSDIFPPDKRAFALGVFYTSQPIGAFLATALGGFVAAEHGWRAAFFLAGVPGLLAAALLLLTVRDPKRGGTEADAPPEAPAKLGEAFTHLWRNPALVWLILGCTTLGLLNITLAAWMSSFFIRVHGLGLAQTGVILGAASATCSLTSPPLFGWMADRLAARNPQWPLRVVWIAGLASFAFTLLQLFTPVLAVAIASFVLAEVLRMGYAPPAYAVLMTRTPARMRGSVMSVVQLTTAAMGFGVGPILTGALSDLYGGGTAIRYAMAWVSLLFIVAAVFLMLASRGLHRRVGDAAAAPAGVRIDGPS